MRVATVAMESFFQRRRSTSMQASESLSHFVDSFAAKRVYSEPYHEGDITIITASSVRGGGGLGQDDSKPGGGGGVGVSARPVGAYVVRGGRVVWKPAFDLSRIALRGQLVMAAALVIAGFVLTRRGSRGRWRF
jgi:uncharacterized spore protein YtfJ